MTEFSAPSDMMPAALDRLRARIDERITQAIEDLERSGPEREHPLVGRVYRWMRHYLDCGGKRMHGIAVMLAYQASGGTEEDRILPVAAAMQLYHHHTLVHDDIYDEDRARRGWPTSHYAFARWYESDARNADQARRLFADNALRRGAIAAFAYGKIGRALASHMILDSQFDSQARLEVARALDWHDLYDNAAQLKDVHHEGETTLDPAQCLENAWLKTGRLFEVCAYAGARLANASGAQRNAVEVWAGQSALAYQLQDDLEDLETASEKGQGRGIATDLMHCKPTYLYALARQLSKDKDLDLLLRWQSGARGGLTTVDVIAVLERSGALAECRREVARCVERALSALDDVRDTMDADTQSKLRDFATYFVSPAYWRRTLSTDPRRAEALLA